MNAPIQLRQIAQYPSQDAAIPGTLVLVQMGDVGSPYASMLASDLVTSALAAGGDLNLSAANGSLNFLFDQGAGAVTLNVAQGELLVTPGLRTSTLNATFINTSGVVVNGDPVVTASQLAADRVASVTSFNFRTGDVQLELPDVLRAGGAPIRDAHFGGWITAPSVWDTRANDDTVATTNWVHRAIHDTGVSSFNCRTGDVVLTTADINAATAAGPGYPTAPSPVLGDASNRIATTLFVDESLQDLHLTISNEQLALLTSTYAPLASPAFTGVPTGPTANPGTATGELATTAFVMHAVTASTTGVSSFNTRTGAVTLQATDISSAGGALLNSPAFVGGPTAPTPAPGTNNTVLATTAFVAAAVTAATAGVSSFNTRTGAVTLTLGDVTSTNVLASPALTGVPTAPTAAPGTATTQIATTAFVTASGVSSFNSRTGAVTLSGADVSAAGGALVASPTFTGTPAAPTPAPGTNSTQIATTAFVVAALTATGVTTFNGRSGAVTLSSGDITGVGGALLASPAFTGTPVAPTAPPGTSSTQIATTAFVSAALSAGVVSFNSRTGAVTLTSADITGAGGALLASPGFTGTPSAPTAIPGTNTTQLATTAFVQAAASAPPVLRSYLAGLTLSAAGASYNFTVAPGVAADSTNARMMTLPSSMTKTINAWGAGGGNGALDVGATAAANTWYHAHLIERTDTGAVDVLVSLSPVAPTLPSPYTLFRRIGSMKTDANQQWIAFNQLGDEFMWVASVGDVNVTNLGTTSTLYTVTVPTGLQVQALGRAGMTNTGGSGAGTNVLIQSPDQNVEVAGGGIGNVLISNANNTTTPHTPATIRTNTSAQIRAVSSLASTTFQWVTYGWIDSRGRNA